MQKDAIYHTSTMARVLADQGKLREAAEIYRHLIKLDPEKRHYKDALVVVEARLQAKTEERVKTTLNRWMSVQLMQKRYQNLKRIRHDLRRIRNDRVLTDGKPEKKDVVKKKMLLNRGVD